jgi:hypothetical protein
MSTPQKRVSLARDGEAALKAVFQELADTLADPVKRRRMEEKHRLARLFSLLEPPAAIDGRKLTKADLESYTLAVNHARRTAKDDLAFLHLAHKKTRAADARFFAVCAAAMDAVKREQAGWNETDGHRMAALQAKLELEERLGRLPLQMQVKKHAFGILMRCRWRTFAPLEPENKRWSKILSSVGLAYLPTATRGNGSE